MLQAEAPMPCAFLAALHMKRQLFSGLAAKVRKRGRRGLTGALLIRFQQAQNFLIGEDVAAYPDAFVADEKRRRSGDQRLYLVLRLTAERAIERIVRLRDGRRGDKKRAGVGRTRSGHLDLG